MEYLLGFVFLATNFDWFFLVVGRLMVETLIC